MRKLYQRWYFQVRTLSNIREKGVMIRLVIYRQIVSSPKFRWKSLNLVTQMYKAIGKLN